MLTATGSDDESLHETEAYGCDGRGPVRPLARACGCREAMGVGFAPPDVTSAPASGQPSRALSMCPGSGV